MVTALTSPYVLGLVVATGATLALAAASLKYRDRPAATPFGVLCVILAAWAATTCVGLVVESRGTRLLLERVHWVYVASVPVFWLTFALEYTGYGDVLTRRRLLALAAPSVGFVVLVFLNPGDLVWVGYSFVEIDGLYLIDQQLGWGTIALSFYLFTVTFAGAGLIVRFGLTAGHLYRGQTLSLVVGVATPILVALFSMVDVTPLRGLNVTPYALSVSAVAFGNAMFRYEFLENAPATRRFGQHVVTQSLRDGVLVVDDSDRVVECNPVAARVLDVDKRAVLGRPITAVVDQAALREASTDPTAPSVAAGARTAAASASPTDPTANATADATTDATADATADSNTDATADATTDATAEGTADATADATALFADVTHLRDDTGTRRYEVERSPVTDQHGGRVGSVYLFRDVTETARREERLAVLNRVLRHNLRNDMNVIEGYATELAGDLDDEHAAVATEIEAVAEDLVDLSLKARTVESVMAETDAGPRRIDRIVDEVVATETDEHPSASFDVAVPAVSVARGDVVAAVLTNVVENALEHAGDAPTVTVRGVPAGAVVEIEVADDGPGIPDAELEALRTGEESALEHASGLGLWIVTWGMERLGGSLTVTVDDGTTITLEFPVAGGVRDPDADANPLDTATDTSQRDADDVT